MSIISTANSLRILKSQILASNRRHEDSLTSITLMKNEDDFKNVIHDIGCNSFYVQYHCAEQIHMYKNY